MSGPIPDEAVELLTSGTHVAHLATSHEDRPHVAPVWYDYHDGAIDIVTTGKKLDNVAGTLASRCRCRTPTRATPSGV